MKNINQGYVELCMFIELFSNKLYIFSQYLHLYSRINDKTYDIFTEGQLPILIFKKSQNKKNY
jgi:hypothetical protein